MKLKVFINIFIAGIFLAISSTSAKSQDIEAKIRISEANVFVEGRITSADSGLKAKNWSFLENYADSDSLGGRIFDLKLSDEKGLSIDNKRLVPGEYEASTPATSFSYTVHAEIPSKLTSAAHVSWISKNHGLLMFSDIFPQWQKSSKTSLSGKVTFELPSGWRIISNETRESETSFVVGDLAKAVFLVGNNVREKRAWIGKNELNLAIIGEWKFTDEQAIQYASDVLQEHRRTFGEFAVSKSQIFLMPFPRGEFSDNWRAETRGATATIISGVLPFKSLAEQRLYEQLRHEIFHFWLPNKLALTGNYDWFYEGFTIYQALRTGIQLNQIRFDDFLNTISQSYRSANNLDSGKLSLIEASRSRWLAPSPIIYTKGLIVAFLCDLAILRESKGKRSLTDVFRQIWKKHKQPNSTEDGNTAILRILEEYPELREILLDYVSGKKPLDFENQLESFGLEYQKSGNKLLVRENLSGKQKDLLDKLGYNQWRKLLEKQK